MNDSGIFVSELSSSKHEFSKYHFCRGNSNKRKTRIGLILKGHGTYIYLNKRLSVNEGDAVFIPENIYCYSEWHGDPEIEVLYLNCFMHYKSYNYEPQIIDLSGEVKNTILKISELLSLGQVESFEAYSLFYKVLKDVVPRMNASSVVLDKTLQAAIKYITDNWNSPISVSDIAKNCFVSESTLYHLFKRELGQTPIAFINSIRINVAIDYLENTNYSVSDISNLVGFNSTNHFRRVFTDLTGTMPLKYRKNK